MLKARDIANTLIKQAKLYPDSQNAPVSQMFEYLKAKHLEHIAPDVLKHLERKVLVENSRQQLRIISPHGVSKATLEKIRSFVGAPEGVSIRTDIDENIVSGFVAYYADKKFDASGKRTLAQLEVAVTEHI